MKEIDWNKKLFKFILVLAPSVMTLGMAMDIYIPSVPKMPQSLNTNAGSIQFTLTVFLLGFGLGQLFMGPLCDRYGRRLLGILSAITYIASSLMCAVAVNVEVLIIARIFQAFGACGTQIVAFAVVKDLLQGKQAVLVINYLKGVMGIAPIVAPIIGAFLDSYFGWRMSFGFLALFGVLVLSISYFILSESLPIKSQIPIDYRLLSRYGRLYGNPQFLIFSACCISAHSVLFCFFSISPHIIISILGFDTTEFSLFFGINAVVFFVSSVVSGKIQIRVGATNTIIYGSSLIFFGGLIMLTFHAFNGLSLLQFLLPSYLASAGVAFVLGNAMAEGIAPYSNMVGTAAAAMGCLEVLVAGLIGNTMMSFGPINDSFPEAITLLFLGSAPLILLFLNRFISKQKVLKPSQVVS
ncbi:MAG: multidrug effflux MFS transporter [Oligoflexales bacterium]